MRLGRLKERLRNSKGHRRRHSAGGRFQPRRNRRSCKTPRVESIPARTHFGYGRNQKTCYREALRLNADVVVMLHPDYQYEPRLVLPIASMIASGTYDVVLGSRILGGTARSGGMPLYKYISNRFLTLVENLFVGAKLSEYHTGYRAFSSAVLRTLPLQANSDDFVFDNEVLAQALYFGFRLGEISCPTKYFPRRPPSIYAGASSTVWRSMDVAALPSAENGLDEFPDLSFFGSRLDV